MSPVMWIIRKFFLPLTTGVSLCVFTRELRLSVHPGRPGEARTLPLESGTLPSAQTVTSAIFSRRVGILSQTALTEPQGNDT